MRNHRILSMLIMSGLLACQDGGTVEGTAAPPDAALPAPVEPVAFTLTVVHDSVVHGRRGPLLAVATQVETGTRQVLELVRLGPIQDAAHTVMLRPGRYSFQLFYDREGDGALDDCPFPPSPGDTAAADSYDNVQGHGEAVVSAGGDLQIHMRRRICGPGDQTTGLRGEVRAPPGVQMTGVPVLLRLEPEVAGQPGDGDLVQTPSRLDLPLFPAGFEAVGRFDVGELIPGRYRLTFFTDDDGDGRPSPCGSGVGGGDRYLGVVEEVVEVVSGERVTLPAAATLRGADECPDALTGLTLSLALPEGMQPSPELGALRLALYSPNGGPAVVEKELNPRWTDPPNYTVTGLPAGTWRLAVWLDRDRDGAFRPCGGLEAGLDSVYAQVEDVRVRAGSVTRLEPIMLTEADCGDEQMALVSGQVWLPAEMGPEGSGRPVRLALTPLDGVGQRRDILLFENHRAELPAPAGFTRGLDVPPGKYRARLYLDADRDGSFRDCAAYPYGDRASAEPFELDVQPGPMLELGERSITVADCPVPEASVRPLVRAAAIVGPLLNDAFELRLLISEAGGWSSDRSLTRPDEIVEGGFEGPMIRLAPGRFQIVVYLDTTANEALDGCNAEPFDAVVGRVEIELNEQAPAQSPGLELSLACGR